MFNRSELIKALVSNVVTVQFTKADGSVRDMVCTLREDSIQPVNGSSSRSDDNIVVVWDLEKDAWRSFKLDKVINYEVAKST